MTLQIGPVESYPLDNTKLNFVAISYNPAKSLSFDIRIVLKTDTSYKEIGEYQLDASNFIDHFVQSENGAFKLKIDFNDDWAAEVELYVERTRYAVERLIREIKNPKPKEEGEAVPLSHQAIKDQRRKLDLKEQEEEGDVHHQQRFKKFSPRRESQEDVQKKNLNFGKREEEPEKKEVPAPPKKEEKKSPKG